MKLNINERLMINALIPKEGDLITQVIAKDTIEKIRLTQEEIKKINMRLEGEGDDRCYRWENDFEKNVKFTEAEINQLKDAVKKLDKDKKINQSNLSLCIKIKEYKNDSTDKDKQ